MKKAAVIGMGDISGIHIQAILNNPEILLTAVCDTDEACREQTPNGAVFYTDYQRMIRQEQPDVVHICLPHDLHVPVAEAAVRMGVHIFCEKPAAMNTAEALHFAEIEATHPQFNIGICLQNRYNETVELLKSFIDSGKYGKVLGLRGLVPWHRDQQYYDCKPWRGKWAAAGGGCMINQSVHTLDLLYYLGGEITGLKGTVSQLLDYGIEVEDTVSARLDYENGATGWFAATNANYKNEGVQIAVMLEQAEFIIMDNVLYRIEPDGSRQRLIEDEQMPGTKFYYGASHAKLINRFYQALEDDSQDYLHVRDAVMSIRLIDAVQESSRTNQYVTINS